MEDVDVKAIRNDTVYPKLFGRGRRGPFPLSAAVFLERFGEVDIDPTWLTFGVYEYAPAAGRPFWLYVTTGNSDPWEATPEDDQGPGLSGAGVEFLFATKTPGDWAIAHLASMLAFDILLSAGRFEGKEPLQPGNVLPLKSPIEGGTTGLIRNCVVSIPKTLPEGFELPSGSVQFLTFTGITDAEAGFLLEQGAQALIDRLTAKGGFPVTDPKRASTV
ncbi:MAG: suppressor of fused domain protein [Rhodobacteraceae bacterium]|nr:suppressor of fused domain protein [Paracoccaceae bacterium]